MLALRHRLQDVQTGGTLEPIVDRSVVFPDADTVWAKERDELTLVGSVSTDEPGAASDTRDLDGAATALPTQTSPWAAILGPVYTADSMSRALGWSVAEIERQPIRWTCSGS